MGSSKTGATDSSATESDITKTDPDMEIDGDDGDCPPDTDSCPFSEGEKVLAFHSVRIYEAKVLSLALCVSWFFSLHSDFPLRGILQNNYSRSSKNTEGKIGLCSFLALFCLFQESRILLTEAPCKFENFVDFHFFREKHDYFFFLFFQEVFNFAFFVMIEVSRHQMLQFSYVVITVRNLWFTIDTI